jgi:hypothetical protein
MENTAMETTGEAPQMSFIQRLTGIYFEPTKTFEDISRKRSWLGIFLVVCIVALVSNYALQSRMDPADAARKGFAMSKPFLKKFLGEEQLAQAEEQAVKQASQPRGFFAKYSPIILTPIMVYITYFVLAAIFLLAFLMTGASLNLRKSFTAVVWGTGPPAILVTLLSFLFIYIKSPADLEIAPVYNVVSNLGMLADSAKQPVLNSLLSSIDLFSIWTAILLSIGFAAMSEKKLTAGKAAVPIVALWVVWILLKMGFWAIVG